MVTGDESIMLLDAIDRRTAALIMASRRGTSFLSRRQNEDFHERERLTRKFDKEFNVV